MSTSLLEQPAARRRNPSSNGSISATRTPSDRLRTTMAAVRVAFTWFGTRKTLTPEQKEQAAESFGAEGTFLSAGKKLLDTRHQAFKAVTAVRHRVLTYWKSNTLPFPEPGIRLLKQDDIPAFDVQLTSLRAELAEAVQALDRHYLDLKDLARLQLGALYNPADYPTSLVGLFGIGWEFPSVEPPNYLRELSPQLYEQECQRVSSRFDEAVRLAEDAFLAELGKLVAHLTERITGQEDGRPKIFRDSAVENLTDFFHRFRALNVRSNAQLDELVEQARRTIVGVEPQDLRTNVTLRQQVSQDLTRIQNNLDDLLVDRPRRNILRRQQQ
jgi:hypothetical protein